VQLKGSTVTLVGIAEKGREEVSNHHDCEVLPEALAEEHIPHTFDFIFLRVHDFLL